MSVGDWILTIIGALLGAYVAVVLLYLAIFTFLAWWVSR